MDYKILKDVLIFTGAGFSKPAGCKLSDEMLKDLKEKLNDRKNNIFTNVEKKMIKFIISCLDYQTHWHLFNNDKSSYTSNIEEFIFLLRQIKNKKNYLPNFVTKNWFNKIIFLEKEFEKEKQKNENDLYTSIEKKIITKYYKEWLNYNNISYLNKLKTFIKNNLSNVNLKLDIFTLNNDLIMEEAFKEENSLYTGFVNNKWVGFENFDIEDNTFSTSRINYYKLHGSLDWARLIDGTIIKNIQENENLKIEIYPFLIFGHGIKTYTIDPFFSLLETFKAKLKEKKYYLIIGYNFLDPHINNFIFNELINNEEKLLLIFNPKINNKIQETDFYINELKILKENKKQILIEEFENIQKNPLYSDTPEFNIKKIPIESFEYSPVKTEEFLDLLNNNKIINFLNNIKNQKNFF